MKGLSKLDIAIIIGGFLAIIGLGYFGVKKVEREKNNEYRIEVYPKYYLLHKDDGSSDTIPFGKAGIIDSLITQDNR